MKRLFTLIYSLLFMTASLYSQDYLAQLNSKIEFDSLSGAPLANKYGNVKAVKIVYDLESKKTFYLNAKTYKNHYEFCKSELQYIAGYGNFLNRNYSTGSKRKYLLANLNHFQSNDKYILEISPIDLMTQKQILNIYKLVKEDHLEIFFVIKLILFLLLKKLKSHLLQF